MLLTVSGAVSAVGAPPVFSSFDRRLPNPDQPYELISGTVDYGTGQFSLYDLTRRGDESDRDFLSAAGRTNGVQL
jgi:hypothetical protein